MTQERFRAQAESFIRGIIKAEIPGITVDDGSAIDDLVIKSGSVITAALSQEIEHTISSRDISDPEAISEDDMDKNLAGLLVPRPSGARSSGPIHFHFTDRKRRAFNAGHRIASKDRQYIYELTEDVVFEDFDHISNPDDGTFYVRITFTATDESVEYDLDIGQITEMIDNAVGAVYARNPEKFQGGEETPSNTEYLRIAKRGVSTRLPITVDGGTFMLQREFGLKLLDVLCIGNGDPEMLRDELHRDGLGQLDLVPTGTPSGIHIGGRQDIFHWYRRLNYVETTVDLSVDLVASAVVSIGAASIQAGFAPGTTTTNVVSLTGGKLVLELGSGNEETVAYASATLNTLTQVYTFVLDGVTTLAHGLDATVKVAGQGRVSVAPGGRITTLPVLRVQSVRTLDPLSLSPVGSPLPQVSPTSREPGWYIADVNKFVHMSAKEEKVIVVDEKRDVAGNAPLSGVDGVISGSQFSSATTDFTGYQGRVVTMETLNGTISALIAKVISANVFEIGAYIDTDIGIALANGTGIEFSVPAGYGDFDQYVIRVGHYTNVEIGEAQKLLDAGRTRVVANNALSRMFYPVFLDFKLRFSGAGTVTTVREQLLRLVQESQGTSFGLSEGARFEVSDIIAAAYENNEADYVETPFEIKITEVNPDGTTAVKWISPGPNTVNDLVVTAANLVAGATVVRAQVQAGRPDITVPDTGKLFLGAFTTNQEVVDYVAHTTQASGVHYFVLAEGQEVAFSHVIGEPLRVSVSDYDPESVITDGVISSDKIHRPYFGVVVVEEIE